MTSTFTLDLNQHIYFENQKRRKQGAPSLTREEMRIATEYYLLGMFDMERHMIWKRSIEKLLGVNQSSESLDPDEASE